MPEKQQLVNATDAQGKSAVALRSEGRPRGTELVEPSDVLITRIQPDGKGGGFRYAATGGGIDEITFTPIFFFKTRVLFGDEDRGDPVVMCRSSNAVAPTEQDAASFRRLGIVPPPNQCTEGNCPFALWGEKDDKGKRSAPKCRLQYNFLGYLAETAEVVILTVHGTSLSVAKAITSDGVKSPRGFWAKTYVLGTKLAGQGTQTYHMLDIKDAQPTKPDESLAAYESIYNDVVGSNPRRAAEILAGGRAEDAVSTSDQDTKPTAAETLDGEEVPF